MACLSYYRGWVRYMEVFKVKTFYMIYISNYRDLLCLKNSIGVAGVRDWYCALVSAEVPCFLKSMQPLFSVLYYEFGNDHDSSDV